MSVNACPRQDLAARAAELIAHIQTAYHDAHRSALARLMDQAAATEALAKHADLVGRLASIGKALEQHMFKEEMRLFPMMEQGGNTLIGRLIEDLHREHDEHLPAVQDLQLQLRSIAESHPTDEVLQHVAEGVDGLARDLADHIRVEDELLFPLFHPSSTAVAPAALPS